MFIVSTKGGNHPSSEGLSATAVNAAVEASLRRLGTDHVDLYLAHEPDDRVPLPDTIAAFEQLRDEGLIAAWGLSNYDATAVEHAEPSLVQNSVT